MRSQLVCGWLAAAGIQTHQLEGGYKALRHALLLELNAQRPLIVVAGPTGSGKTDLLHALKGHVLDLELGAQHRGSAFGAWHEQLQPAQATFENRLALQLLRLAEPSRPTFVEDESRLIGNVGIPAQFHSYMQESPVVVIDEDLETRTARIYRSYIEQPLLAGMKPELLHAKALVAVGGIKKRLLAHLPQILQEMDAAFAQSPSLELHQRWIATLLSIHYDLGYAYGMKRLHRPVLFRGNLAACKEWCLAHL